MVFALIRGEIFLFFIITLVCPDNWYFKPLCVRTIGDTIDCQDTYVKIRVFYYFFEDFLYLLFLGHLVESCIGLLFKPLVKTGQTRGLKSRA